jgi:hypothetical protein
MTTKYVLVFMLISSININIRVNRRMRMFRKYPKAGPVLEAPFASFPVLNIVLVRV